MISAWKKPFSLKQLSLTHENPVIFVVSQWQRDSTPSVIYLIYRWIIALTFVIIWLLSIIGLSEEEKRPEFRSRWLIYLTNWGFTCCTVQAVIVACILTGCVIAVHKTKSNLQEQALKFYKAYWLTYTISTDLAIGITIVYWTLLYDEKTMVLDPMNILVHGVNTLLMALDLFIVAHPIRFLHCIYPCIFGLSYALFSVFYYLAGGKGRDGTSYIYPILKWEKPTSALVTCLGVMSFLIFLHICQFGMFKIRQLIHKNIFPPAELVESMNLPDGNAPSKTGYVNEAMTTETV